MILKYFFNTTRRAGRPLFTEKEKSQARRFHITYTYTQCVYPPILVLYTYYCIYTSKFGVYTKYFVYTYLCMNSCIFLQYSVQWVFYICETRLTYMGVNLRSLTAFMSEYFLYIPQIHTTFKQMGCKTVS